MKISPASTPTTTAVPGAGASLIELGPTVDRVLAGRALGMLEERGTIDSPLLNGGPGAGYVWCGGGGGIGGPGRS